MYPSWHIASTAAPKLHSFSQVFAMKVYPPAASCFCSSRWWISLRHFVPVPFRLYVPALLRQYVHGNMSLSSTAICACSSSAICTRSSTVTRTSSSTALCSCSGWWHFFKWCGVVRCCGGYARQSMSLSGLLLSGLALLATPGGVEQRSSLATWWSSQTGSPPWHKISLRHGKRSLGSISSCSL